MGRGRRQGQDPPDRFFSLFRIFCLFSLCSKNGRLGVPEVLWNMDGARGKIPPIVFLVCF